MSVNLLSEYRNGAILEPSWQIRHTDCVSGLADIGTGSARLIFTDMPYNIGIDYGHPS
jgi:hypothetical protein